MNSPKIFSSGLLLLSAGCLTTPGDLGAIGGDSDGAESGMDASTSASETTGQTSETATTEDVLTTGETSGETTTGEDIDPPGCDVGVGLQRRLTSTQVENAISDVFDVEVEVQFNDDSIPFESAESLSAADSMSLALIAANVAGDFAVPACAGDEDACAQEFMQTYVPVVLRGQGSVDAFTPIYEEVGEYEAGIRSVVGAMITHPAFIDLTPTGSNDAGLVALDANSLATRLALLVWNSVPDAELLDAADGLLQPGGVEAQLGSMLNDDRFGRAQADLYSAVTGVHSLAFADRSTAYEDWSESIAASMVEEQRRFVADLVAEPGASLEGLLTSSSTFVNTDLAALYGADLQTPAPAGNNWAPGELDPARRAGLLTQLGMITAGSYDTPAGLYPAPSARGISVLFGFFCSIAPDSPPGVEPLPGALESREHWEQLVGDPTCAGCHDAFDPLGFAFGDYDGVGRWDPQGDATNATHAFLDEEFADAIDLGAQLAGNGQVQECMAQRYYTFALRRPLEAADQCAVEEYTQAFVDSGGNLRALVQAIATSDSFRFARASD